MDILGFQINLNQENKMNIIYIISYYIFFLFSKLINKIRLLFYFVKKNTNKKKKNQIKHKIKPKIKLQIKKPKKIKTNYINY
jgi:hypothetical protein